jgi:hypothetical protein
MIYRIEDLESLGDTLRACLAEAGLKNTRHILEKCATAKDLAALAAQSGIAEAQILHCVHIADLLRVKGVGDGYAGLLVAAGVPTVALLKDADPDALMAQLTEAKPKVKHVDRLPHRKDVARWIEDAASLTPIFT